MGSWLIQLMVWAYRRFLRDRLGRECLFQVSCSEHVRRIAVQQGAFASIKAFRQRARACRGGYSIVLHGRQRCIQSDLGAISPYRQLTDSVRADVDAAFLGVRPSASASLTAAPPPRTFEPALEGRRLDGSA